MGFPARKRVGRSGDISRGVGVDGVSGVAGPRVNVASRVRV